MRCDSTKDPTIPDSRRGFDATFFALVLMIGALGCARTSPQVEGPPSIDSLSYFQLKKVVYDKVGRSDLTMDVFLPSDGGNGRGIIDVASAGLYSDRGTVEVHKRAGMYDILCRHGFTVFAVRPGSAPRWTVLEMLAHVQRAIQYVKCHARTFHIDPERLGITGGAAGGHLAGLAAVTGSEDISGASDGLDRYNTWISAAAIFFAPTDLTGWNRKGANYAMAGPLLFRGGVRGKSRREIQTRVEAISPSRLVRPGVPSFLLIHGDADKLIPLQQSLDMADAIMAVGGKARLIVKKDAGHTWPTIAEEIEELARWFDRELET